MIGRKSFQDSVDDDKRLSIDFLANPKWKRDQFCWAAKGPIAEKYKDLEPQIRAELNQSRKESSSGVNFSLFMVGTTIKRAKPIIIFSSTDKKSRKDARKAIDRSDLLACTDFELGELQHPPSGGIKPVAMADEWTAQVLSSTSQCEILFDPMERVRLVGMPIFIKHDTTSVRRATANVVYDGRHYGYVTAAHALKEAVFDDEDTDDEDGMDMPFDSDSESDDEGHDEGERDLLSLHSDSSPEGTESEGSFLSLQGPSFSRGSSLQNTNTDPSFTSEQIALQPQPEPSVDSDDDTDKSLPVRYRTLGDVSAVKKSLDYAVIVVTDTEVISILEKLKNALKDTEYPTGAADAKNVSVVAWTSHGPLHGILMDVPLSMRLANSDSYELVHEFLYHKNRGIKMGDCGTLVTDAESGALYGHIIAKSENVRVAYIMAAQSMAQDMDEAGQWRLLCTTEKILTAEWVVTTPEQLPVLPFDDFVPPTTDLNEEKLSISSPRRRANLTVDTTIAQKSEIEVQDTEEYQHSESFPASATRPLRMRTQPMSPAGFSIGNMSLLFQVFAWSIQGYELIADICRSHKDYKILSRLRLEECCLVNLAKIIKMDYTDENLAVNDVIRSLIVNVMDQQRILLFCFLEQEGKTKVDTNGMPFQTKTPVYANLASPWQQNNTTTTTTTTTEVDAGKANEIKASDILLTEDETVQKAFGFLKQFQDSPPRLRWGAYDSDQSGRLVMKLSVLNHRMFEAIGPEQTRDLIGMQQRPVDPLVVLNRKVLQSERTIQSQVFTSPTSQGFRHDDPFGHVGTLSCGIEGSTVLGSEPAKEVALSQPPGFSTDCGTKLSIEDMFTQPGELLSSILDDIDEGDRTVAFYKDIPVWIEWKASETLYLMQDYGQTEERVKKLSATLEMNSNDPYQFCVPHGLGYFVDEDNGRFGLVFEKPSATPDQAPVTLYSLFQRSSLDESFDTPSLTDRIALMRILSETVERLHAVDWLHKDLRSANILFFKDAETNGFDLSNLLVSGFSYSRPATRGDMTERPLDDPEADLYRHPTVQMNRNTGGFKKRHDIYALGVVLLEIAYWKSLDHILNIDPERVRPKDSYRVRGRLLDERMWLRNVRSYNGDSVESVIRLCLEGPEAFGIKEDLDARSDGSEAELQRAFGEQVVAKLAGVRGL